ncbi:PREDICTED: probable G-protein coupled receptor 32 [Elephantulus edwardii]|uniref:probable G-protein coupled receptor 32 n=1 Tax=Elephantulus edwardii TaxID=28737 RepID=UPI0003F0ECA4|nr:PREDICTED: probable G-protein coupled receptor 32 [Elephantulus edwardii]
MALICGDSCSRKIYGTSMCNSLEMWPIRVLIITILCVFFVTGVTGNGLVLWMTLFRLPRTVTTIWFLNLALADFSVLLSLPIPVHNLIQGQWFFGAWGCKFYQAFLNLNFFTSIYLLVLISVDRCVSVLYPIWARNHRTVRRASWLAAGVWLLASLTSIPYLIFRTTGVQKDGCNYCYFNFNIENKTMDAEWKRVVMTRRLSMTVAHLLLGFLVPLVVISTCAHLIRVNFPRGGWVHARGTKRLLLVLVSTFFACWFPFNVALCIQLWRFMVFRRTIDPHMLLFLWGAFSLSCLNSCLNPFLYVLIGRDFQKKFFQSIPHALARVFGEEGVLNLPALEAEPPGHDGNLQVETGSPSA